MALLQPNEIESELSYAYLHAVASKAGMSCETTGRHTDNMGVDAQIRAVEVFTPDSILTDISLDVQLKATINKPPEENGKISYFIKGVERYEKLRKNTIAIPRILVVYFLPEKSDEWLQQTNEHLILRRCAWWVSLKGGIESNNQSGQTVYLPNNQVFNVEELRRIMMRLSIQEDLHYEG
jgi:hypothetical protein